VRIFYDAVTPSNIPADAQGVCGYVDGIYKWTLADWARFPNAVKVRIAVFSKTNDGHVLDVEPGCSAPEDAPNWVMRRRAAGVHPTVYCSAHDWDKVRQAFAAAGVPEPEWWIAAYPGNGPNLYGGSIAHQYANPGPVDISVVADVWPGVDVVVVSHSEENVDMKVVKCAESKKCWWVSGGGKMYLATQGQLKDHLALCGQSEPQVIGQFTLDRIPEFKALP
jgi:hypothetical protein